MPAQREKVTWWLLSEKKYIAKKWFLLVAYSNKLSDLDHFKYFAAVFQHHTTSTFVPDTAPRCLKKQSMLIVFKTIKI